MLMNRMMLPVISGWTVCLSVLAGLPAGLPAGPSPAGKPESRPAAKLPAPPARIAGAAVRSQACVECHEEIADLLEGDKHVAGDFHCVVCHGESKAHLEKEEESALPDRTWRRWIEEENRFEWRMKNASLEIAGFCASCHGRKPAEGKQKPAKEEQMKRIDWKGYLETGHGRAVWRGDHDAPTCTDCHYAHGAGCEPLTNKTIVRRCSVCHGDQQMIERAGLDPNVMKEFQAQTHGDMDSASVEKKSSCIPCHDPH